MRIRFQRDWRLVLISRAAIIVPAAGCKMALLLPMNGKDSLNEPLAKLLSSLPDLFQAMRASGQTPRVHILEAEGSAFSPPTRTRIRIH